MIFEQATRQKLRFPFRGTIGVEDLWDLDVYDLDKIFKNLNAELKVEKEESLLEPVGRETTELELQVSVVRHIVQVKLEEIEKRRTESERAEKKQRLLEIIHRKQNAALEDLSEEDLKKMVDEL